MKETTTVWTRVLNDWWAEVKDIRRQHEWQQVYKVGQSSPVLGDTQNFIYDKYREKYRIHGISRYWLRDH